MAMPTEIPDTSKEDARLSVGDGLACNGCRKSKLRCSRDRPSCLHCKKTGLACVYQTKRIKPGLKPGAIDNLHRRLDDIERRLNEQATICERNSNHARDRARLGAINECNEPDPLNILTLLAKELPKLLDKPKSQQTETPTPSSETSNKKRRLNEAENIGLGDDDPQLPESGLLHRIVRAYFDHVHPWIPMIHQGKFTAKISHIPEQKGQLVILHAMIVAASKFVPDACFSSRTTTINRRWVIITAMEWLSLESLQALIIIAFVHIGDGNASKAWSIVGSLTRTVEYAQLAQEHEEDAYRPLCHPYKSLSSTIDWTEVEERRRVFWTAFLLDRFCSVTMGWNTSLTSDDVNRRLPCDGHLWRKEKPVVTPFFGIWDKSRGKIGNPINFATRNSSPVIVASETDLHDSTISAAPNSSVSMSRSDLSTIGALAYNIEATESMSRVVSYFLQQKVNLSNQSDINSWLTRFKELDLRLVHWKMLLPQRWNANPNLTRHVPMMDPNLTTAHVTHNASMILLHQLIAYPPLHWGFRTLLPSTCSAEACYSAGVEIATITEKYLSKSPSASPMSNQYAFCIFIAARVLLAHWRYAIGNELAAEFWSLVQSLHEMSRRWKALSKDVHNEQNLFEKYSCSLQELYEHCTADDTYQIDLMDYASDVRHQQSNTALAGSSLTTQLECVPTTVIEEENMHHSSLDFIDISEIPPVMLGSDFLDMDRVIAFNDGSMFTSSLDSNIGSW